MRTPEHIPCPLVALRFQTVINAEGDLAARTDLEWIAALAKRGFSIGYGGEIEQLAHIVRPLSKRSRQIERNRTNRLDEWRLRHLALNLSRKTRPPSTSGSTHTNAPRSLARSAKPTGWTLSETRSSN